MTTYSSRPIGLSIALLLLVLLASCSGNEEKAPKSTTAIPVTVDTSSPAMTEILWLDSTFDFGRVIEGETVEASFRFRNIGDQPLIISNVSPACGCTVAEKPQAPIAPGAEGLIRASFDSRGRTGTNNKTINVYSNTQEGMRKLAFTVEVQEKK